LGWVLHVLGLLECVKYGGQIDILCLVPQFPARSSTSTTPPSLGFGAPWRGVGRDVGFAKSGRARGRLVADLGVRLRRAQSSRSVERSAALRLCGESPLGFGVRSSGQSRHPPSRVRMASQAVSRTFTLAYRLQLDSTSVQGAYGVVVR
jgi:hypothetical protein